MSQATPTQTQSHRRSVVSDSDPAFASTRALLAGRDRSTAFLTLTVTRSAGVQVTTIELGNSGQQQGDPAADPVPVPVPVPADTIDPAPPPPPPATDSDDGGTSEGTVIIVVVVLFILFFLFTVCCLCRTRRKGGGYVGLCGPGGRPGRRGPRGHQGERGEQGVPVSHHFLLLSLSPPAAPPAVM